MLFSLSVMMVVEIMRTIVQANELDIFWFISG